MGCSKLQFYSCKFRHLDLVWELNEQSAKIAREVTEEYSDKPRFVAGSIGPTNKTASISPDVNRPGFRATSFDELKNAYKEQAEALASGGVDIFLVETVFDTLNCKAALMAIQELKDVARAGFSETATRCMAIQMLGAGGSRKRVCHPNCVGPPLL